MGSVAQQDAMEGMEAAFVSAVKTGEIPGAVLMAKNITGKS